ncbi:MAG: hypothetical protein ISS26_06515 [Candidatus Omnitrophica bacterium]|nr:hypothetical protein [Candidatus Omnitrophota bacterium]
MRFIALFTVLLALSAQAWAFSASYDQAVSVTGISKPQISSVIIKDDKMKMDADSPKGRVVSIMDGKTIYSYIPAENKAVKFVVQSTPKIDTLSRYGHYLREIGAVVIGSERIGEYDCDIYEFKDPKNDTKTKAWLWKEKDFPIKVENNVPDGIVTTIIKNLKIGIHIDDSEFMLPEGVKITEMPVR